ncbi:MAG: sensor histidine kinase [Spirochaetaceae bacterium]
MKRTQPSERKRRLILALLAGALVVLVTSGFVFLISQRRDHDRTLMEYEALQAATALTEYYARYGELDESALPPNVAGFGLYDTDGRAAVRVGSAPAVVTPELLGGAPASQLDTGERQLRILRPVAAPQATRFGPMNRMSEGIRDGMSDEMPRHMGPRGGPPRTGPDDELGGGDHGEYLLLDYDVSRLLSTTRTRLAYWSAAGLALAVLIGAVGVLSARIRRFEEERRRREHLVQLGEAARTLAHEIRNPLGAIRLQTATLRKYLSGGHRRAGNEAPEQPGAGGRIDGKLDILDEEVGRIDALVNQLREFLQDPVGSPETIELGTFLRGLPARYAFSVAVTVLCERPCEIRFDRHRLHSVLGNVLRNAAEAGDGEEPVELTARRHESRVEIRVADRGPGLPDEEAAQRAFDPFYTRKTEGFGVGLAVSRRFVEAAGGTITLRNRSDGPGAECRIILPGGGEHARAHR